MKAYLKKTLSILIVVFMLLSAVPFAVFAATTVNTWSELASAVASASAGDTITLGADLTATGPITVNGSVTINGDKTITRAASSADSVFIVNGTLNLTNVTINGNRTSTSLSDLANALVVVNNGATVNLNSGACIMKNRANAVISGGGVTVTGGTLNMYDGAVIQDMHVHNATANGAQYVGPAVTVFSGAFNMYGGIIRYNDGHVGAVSVLSGTFTMNDGTISDNIANNNGVGGGGVYNAGTFTMNGGTISGNTSWKNGGGVYNAGVFNLIAGEISGNSATINETNNLDCNGAGVYTIGTMTMSGGRIVNNTSKGSAGGILIEGGVCNMTGGEISGNSTVSYSGGGVFAGGTGSFNMSGGSITGNAAHQFGGAIAVTSTASRPIYVTGGVINGNTCGNSNCGSDIYVTTDGNIAATTLGSGCIQYKLYLDNTNSRYSASNAHLAPSSTLTKNYGYIYVMTGSAHTFGAWSVTVQPGCETTGMRTRTCTVCGATEEEVIPASGHAFDEETVSPGCTTAGYRRTYCTVCGYESSRTVLPATGHTPGNWKIQTPATASSAGTKIKICNVCGAVADTASYTLNDAIVKVSFSEPVELDSEYNSVTATISISNNPGLWALGFYFYYDSAFTVISAEPGNVFTGTNASVSAEINVASDTPASRVFAASGEPVNGVRALFCYAESSTLANTYTDGTLATIVLKYDADIDDAYYFGFAYDPADVINAASQPVDVLFAGKNETIEPIIVCDHVPGNWTTSVSATCTESGLRVKTCTICGRVLESETIAPLGHQTGSWVVTVQPGVNEGERVKYCTRCGIVLETEVLRPTQTINVYSSDVTATTGGNASFDFYIENNSGIWGARLFVYYSSDISVASVTNGSIFSTPSVEFGPYNMNPYANEIAAPIFSAQGITEQGILATCIYFEDDEFSNVTANGKLVTVTFSIPDGVTGDYTIHAFCDEAINSAMNDVVINCYDADLTIVSCAHTNTAWSITTAPTCTEAGVRSLVCSDCGAVLDTEAIPATGHTPDSTWVVTVVPTCTQNGVRVRYCTVCGAAAVTETVAAVAHTPGDWSITVQPTCTVAGTKVKTCTVCGATIETGTVPAAGHTPGGWTTIIPPTCTEPGLKIKACTVCSVTLETEEIPATGHTPGTPVTISPTCTESGLMTIRCTVCQQIITSSYAPALGHDFGEWQITVEPTCTEPGTKVKTCSRCGLSEDEEIPANGHTFSDEWTIDIEPTTSTPGQKSHHCIYCDAVTDITAIDPIVQVLIGDVNGDGDVDAKDVRQMKKYISGAISINEIVFANADIVQDDAVDSKDLKALKKIVAGASS